MNWASIAMIQLCHQRLLTRNVTWKLTTLKEQRQQHPKIMKNNFSCSRNRSLLPPDLEIMNKRPMIVLFWIEIHTWYTSYCIHCIPNLWAATEWPTQKTLVGSKGKVWMMGPKKWDFPDFPKDALHIHFQGPITRQNTQSVINEQLTIKIKKDSLDSFF